MRVIPLNRGLVALVSDEDYDRVAKNNWFARPARSTSGTFYVYRSTLQGKHPVSGKKWFKCIYLHRWLLEAPDGSLVDHVNGDPLDNRRENLRLATRQLNAVNRQYSSASGYRGVSKKRFRWYASITVDGKLIRLGSFSNAIDAANAYDAAAREHFGQFAVLNDASCMSLGECA